MCQNEFTGNSQSETDPGNVARRTAAIEGLENMGCIAFGDARALIDDIEPGC